MLVYSGFRLDLSGGTKRQTNDSFLKLFWLADFTLDAALHYAGIRAALKAKGTPIGPLDLLIAAQARSLGATLVTSNVREFKRIKGLKLLAWKGSR